MYDDIDRKYEEDQYYKLLDELKVWKLKVEACRKGRDTAERDWQYITKILVDQRAEAHITLLKLTNWHYQLDNVIEDVWNVLVEAMPEYKEILAGMGEETHTESELHNNREILRTQVNWDEMDKITLLSIFEVVKKDMRSWNA